MASTQPVPPPPYIATDIADVRTHISVITVVSNVERSFPNNDVFEQKANRPHRFCYESKRMSESAEGVENVGMGSRDFDPCKPSAAKTH